MRIETGPLGRLFSAMRSRVVLVGVGAAMTMTLAACGGGDSGGAPSVDGGGEAQRGGTLQFGFNRGESAEKLDPALSGQVSSIFVAGHVFERLADQTLDFDARPALAERWTSNKNATKWTFSLRRGVLFSDGSPMTAKDVKFSLERVLDESLGSSGYTRLAESLKPSGIDVVDDHTIEFALRRPDALFAYVLGNRQNSILKAGTPKTLTVATAIGTGPFKVKSWSPGRSFELVRNGRYRVKGLPHLDGVRATFYAEPAALAQAAAAGSVQLTNAIDAPTARAARGGSADEYVLKGAQSVVISMNQDRAPFNKPQVREAFKLVVDRQQLLNTVFGGAGSETGDVVADPADPFYPKGLGVPKRDVARARQLLAEAGFAGGVDVELYASAAVPNSVALATAFAEQARDAGIRVKVREWPAGTYYDEVWLKKTMYVDTWLRRHPIDAMTTFFTSKAPWNGSKFNDPRLDDLVAKALATTDKDAQNAVVAQALSLIQKESGTILPVFGSTLDLRSKRLHGLVPTYDHGIDLRNAWLAQ